MKPSIIRAVLSPETPANVATVRVALGLIETLSNELTNDLQTASEALQQRRRPSHHTLLERTKSEAESLSYVSKWLQQRIRPKSPDDDIPFVIMGIDEEIIE